MLTPHELTETLLNCNKQLTELAAYMQKDLERYKAESKNPHPFYIDMKQKQVNILTDACDTYLQIFDEIMLLQKAHQKREQELKDKIFRLEGCCLYHGVSVNEIGYFFRCSIAHMVSKVKQAFDEGWRQKPQYFTELVICNKPDELTMYDKPKLEISTLKKLAANG